MKNGGRKEKTYITDETGSFVMSGFLGDYEIYAKGSVIASFELLNDDPQEKIILNAEQGQMK